MKGSIFGIALIVVVAFGGLFVIQQRRAARAPDHRLHVVTTILPLYVFTKNIAGNVADVSNLVPPGTELHDYAMSPSDAAAIVEADVVVKNGYGLDDFVDTVVANNSRANHTAKIVDAGSLVDSTKPGLGASSPDGSFSVSPEKSLGTKHANPHIWVNPAYAVHMVESIRNGLMQADPKNASSYAVNTENYLERLLAVDAKFRVATRNFKDPIYVAEEPSMTYLASEYGLIEAAVVSGSPEASLSPRDMSEIIKLMKENRITVIFKNRTSAAPSVASIAKDAKAKVYDFDAFESGDTGVDLYERVMEKNLETLIRAFK
ncbi:MAG: metal ABC transporter substrate-binding protein [bacterium]